jgi:hypothetical protein
MSETVDFAGSRPERAQRNRALIPDPPAPEQPPVVCVHGCVIGQAHRNPGVSRECMDRRGRPLSRRMS